MAIIAGGGILAGIVGAYAIRFGRRIPWMVRVARRIRAAWLDLAGPVLAKAEKRLRILYSDARAWTRDHIVSSSTPR